MSEGHARQVRVTYRRYVSDGNYGTEGAEVTLEAWIEPEDADLGDDVEGADELLMAARDVVRNRLRTSDNPAVRRAVQAPRPTTPPSTAATAPGDDEEERLPF